MKTLRSSLFLLAGTTLTIGLGLFAHGCSGGSSGGGAPAPVGPPLTLNVIGFAPPNAATGVPLNGQVVVIFDRDVNPTSLNDTNIIVQASGTQITGGSYTYDSVTRTLTWVPPAQFSAMVTHTVTLTTGVLSTSGTSLTSGSFSFTTGNTADMTDPTWTATGVSVTVENGVSISLTWNTTATDDTDPQASLHFRIYRATTSGGHTFTLTDLVGVAGAGETTFTDRGLSPSTTYYYVVRAVDTSGHEDNNTVEDNGMTSALRSWGTDVYPLFNLGGAQTCQNASCHDTTNSGGLIMTSPAVAHAELVNIVSSSDGGCSTLRRVEPGEPDRSLLYLKLTTPPCGSIMPNGAITLSNPQLDIISDWIEEGAANN